jgi:hypothetical protein
MANYWLKDPEVAIGIAREKVPHIGEQVFPVVHWYHSTQKFAKWP